MSEIRFEADCPSCLKHWAVDNARFGRIVHCSGREPAVTVPAVRRATLCECLTEVTVDESWFESPNRQLTGVGSRMGRELDLVRIEFEEACVR